MSIQIAISLFGSASGWGKKNSSGAVSRHRDCDMFTHADCFADRLGWRVAG